ncbi:hypothetical protein EVAR_62630_1 [Eumeta japonica]|uniref:Uncharacterized protein n=1 Tax=Eumeta variegata TaxID=151549 RepID=A0A4C1ZEE0_EUMVA|nr:hypothetical protein EVAR_62630_1 [Eumeta japonica]
MILRRSTPCFAFLNLAARSETSALLTTWRMDIIVVMSSPSTDAAVPAQRDVNGGDSLVFVSFVVYSFVYGRTECRSSLGLYARDSGRTADARDATRRRASGSGVGVIRLYYSITLINLVFTFPKLLSWIYMRMIANYVASHCIETPSTSAEKQDWAQEFKDTHWELRDDGPALPAANNNSLTISVRIAVDGSRKDRLPKDATEAANIKKFLRFVKLRPFALRICRLVPVDARLPVGLLSLCTTYVIVLAQFHHQGQKI